MKKVIIAAIISVFLAAASAAAEGQPEGSAKTEALQEGSAVTAPAKKKVFMQVGAIEKVEADKYTMRKTETRFEFYTDDNTRIFLRSECGPESVAEKYYLVIKGPKNKKTILANSVYVFGSRDEYEAFQDKKEDNPDKAFSSMIEGTVKQKDPLIITPSEGTGEYAVSFDDETYWILTKKSDKSELKPGERVKLFFDKLYSIRYKNYPIKIVVDRVKAGF